MEKGPTRKRIWEQAKQIEETVKMRTFRSPVCGAFLFEVPTDQPVPEERVEMVCPNGHS